MHYIICTVKHSGILPSHTCSVIIIRGIHEKGSGDVISAVCVQRDK